MVGESLLVVEEVTKRYGETLAVDAVSLRVGAGEVYALLGANGAGKSTLIRMMTGLSEPDAGGVIVCGEEMRRRLTERIGSSGMQSSARDGAAPPARSATE